MTQVLASFKDGTSAAEIEAFLTIVRQIHMVARVELISDREAAGLARLPTADQTNPDVTVRGDEMFFKGPDGALLAQLNEPEGDVVRLLVKRRKLGKNPIRGSKTLLKELQTAWPGRWGDKSISAATDAYRDARLKLAGTEWELIETPRGTYGFKITGGVDAA